jgi:O-antigen ligase
VAVRSLSAARAAALEGPAVSAGAAALAVALPLVFLHVDYQPGFTVSAGSTEAHLYLSDFAVLATGLAALAAGLRRGFSPLRAGRPIWLAGGALVFLVLAACLYPLALDETYRWRTHLVTAGKFAEYVLLALAVPLLVRSRRDLQAVLVALIAWSAAATVVGVAQFFGADLAGPWPAGRRQPSFLGHHDFAALSSAALGVAVATVALRRRIVPPAVAAVAAVAGALGIVVSGSTAAAIGLAAGLAAAALVSAALRRLSVRRLAVLAAIGGLVAAGVVTLRGNDYDQFLRFLGVRKEEAATRENVQTYVHHTLLSYIGWRIFLDHPVLGAGWQASGKEPSVYLRYLPAAHREFPDAAPLSFPSRERQYGVQNGYVQALADLGAVGFVLLVGTFLTGLAIALRAALRGPPEGLLAVFWLLAAMGIWSAVGLVAGIPLDGLTWLALGLAATAAGALREST